jgi:hypothetical protein
MQNSSFFIAFAAFVQICVAFDFGFLYLFKNNRSVFKSIFDEVRKGAPFSWVMGFAAEQVKLVKPKAVSDEVNQLRGRVAKKKDELMSPANHEYMCDYMAVTGVVSGLYGMLWLLLVPWLCSPIANAENIYLTLTTSTVIAEILMVIFVFYRKFRGESMQMTRAAMVLRSTIVLMVCCLVGCLLLKMGWVMETEAPFHQLFLLSMAVTLGPVCLYLLHLAFTFICRLCKSALLFNSAMHLRRDRMRLSKTKR